MQLKFFLLPIFALLTLSECQVALNCRFDPRNSQKCNLYNVVISNRNDEVTIESFPVDQVSITSVVFHNSSLSHIPNELFRKFENLENINVQSTGLKEMNNLEHCESLKSIYAADNQIEILTGDNFRNCKNLGSFYFRNNPIYVLDSGFFSKNLFYLSLDFQNCKISQINRDFFDGIEHLNYLNLIGNVCANKDFVSIKQEKLHQVFEALEKCFENFIPETSTLTITAPIETSPDVPEETTQETTTEPITEPQETTTLGPITEPIETTTTTLGPITEPIETTTGEYVDSTTDDDGDPPIVNPSTEDPWDTTPDDGDLPIDPNPNPKVLPKLICKYDVYKAAYHCETLVPKITVIED